MSILSCQMICFFSGSSGNLSANLLTHGYKKKDCVSNPFSIK